MDTRIFLCGGINKLTDAECRDWREEAQRLLVPYPCHSPMMRDYRGQEVVKFIQIVKGDIYELSTCGTMLVNATRPSWGTAMKVRIAYELGKRIVGFGAGEQPSPWLVYHCHLVDTLESAAKCIRNYFERPTGKELGLHGTRFNDDYEVQLAKAANEFLGGFGEIVDLDKE